MVSSQLPLVPFSTQWYGAAQRMSEQGLGWQLPWPSFSTHWYGDAQRMAAQGTLPVDTHPGLPLVTLHFCPG